MKKWNFMVDMPDRIQRPGQYLLLGSATPRAMHKTGSLLGKAITIEVGGFNIEEARSHTWRKMTPKAGRGVPISTT